MMGLQEIDQRTDDDEGTLRGYKMAGATTTTEISGVRWGQVARPHSKRFPLSLWVCLVVVTLRREVTRVIPPLRTESFSALLADRSFRDSFPCCQAMAACSSFHRANTHTHTPRRTPFCSSSTPPGDSRPLFSSPPPCQHRFAEHRSPSPDLEMAHS